MLGRDGQAENGGVMGPRSIEARELGDLTCLSEGSGTGTGHVVRRAGILMG